MKRNLTFAIILSLLAASCDGSESNDPHSPATPTDNGTQVTVTTQRKAILDLDIRTDKACYKPGETVKFTVMGNIPNGATVRYLTAGKIVETASEEVATNS